MNSRPTNHTLHHAISSSLLLRLPS